MGKLSGGILGPVKGKVGAIVGSVVGGQNVVKSMPASYNDKNSVAQQTQRTSFKESLLWYKALAGIVLLGFVERLAYHSAYNVFMKSNIAKSILTAVPIWEDLILSKGSLVNPTFAVTANTNDDELEFSWTDDSDGSSKLATDECVFIAIDPVSREIVYSNGDATRGDGTYLMTVPATIEGIELRTYAFIRRADGEKASNTVYSGRCTGGSDLAGSVQ